MAYRQKKTPNLAVPAKRGWCLAYVDDAGQATKRQPSAQKAYSVEKLAGRIKANKTFPVGVWVVAYFSINSGPFKGLGHVVFVKNLGKSLDIRDSEVRTGARKPYTSIAQVLAWLGNHSPRYLGWSTHCDGVQYAQYVSPAYPKWVTVKVPILYVRDKPTTKSKLAGSRILTKGMRVRATAVVTGQSVNGNNKWYKSVHNNFFWTGGTK